jgi:hypothetical protein
MKTKSHTHELFVHLEPTSVTRTPSTPVRIGVDKQLSDWMRKTELR